MTATAEIKKEKLARALIRCTDRLIAAELDENDDQDASSFIVVRFYAAAARIFAEKFFEGPEIQLLKSKYYSYKRWLVTRGGFVEFEELGNVEDPFGGETKASIEKFFEDSSGISLDSISEASPELPSSTESEIDVFAQLLQILFSPGPTGSSVRISPELKDYFLQIDVLPSPSYDDDEVAESHPFDREYVLMQIGMNRTDDPVIFILNKLILLLDSEESVTFQPHEIELLQGLDKDFAQFLSGVDGIVSFADKYFKNREGQGPVQAAYKMVISAPKTNGSNLFALSN